MANQMEKKMEHEMETGVILGLYWFKGVGFRVGFTGPLRVDIRVPLADWWRPEESPY